MQKKFQLTSARILKTLFLAILLIQLSACQAYRLGSPVEIPFKSIYIAPVTNHSYAPQAQAIISTMLREDFIQDARVHLVATKKTADAVLFVDLTEYERNSTARNQQDTVVADSFDVRLGAKVSLLDQRTGDYLFRSRPVRVTTNAYTNNPYNDDPTIVYQLSERQAMEQLAREMARKVSNEVLSPW